MTAHGPTYQQTSAPSHAASHQPMEIDEPEPQTESSLVESKPKLAHQNGVKGAQDDPPPTQSSVPDRRATQLNDVFERAVSTTLRKVSYENFAACFPTPAEFKPQVLKRFWGDFVGRLGDKWREQFLHILTKRNVISSLNSFDHLIADAVSRKRIAEGQAAAGGSVETPVPPHTLSPDALLVAKLGPWLGDQQGVLNGTLKELEGENEKLGGRIVEQRRELQQLVVNLEMLVKDLENSAEMVGGAEGIRGVALAEDMEE